MLFLPDKADYRRSFEDEREFMGQVINAAGADAGPNFTPSERFYDAWRRFPEDDASRILGLIGADEFARRFESSLRRAHTWILAIIQEHLSHLATVLEPIDEVTSGGTLDLVRWSGGELGQLGPNGHMDEQLTDICSIADGWGDDHDLIREESLRALTLASRFQRLGAVDGWGYVTKDMTRLNELCSERLWVGRKMLLTVNYAVYKDGDHRGQVHPEIPITFGKERASVTWDSEQRSQPVKCRVVRDGGTTYLVHTRSRAKDLEATVLKEMELDPKSSVPRCRTALDRRGIMHVLVAIGVAGNWRVATPDDNQAFAALVSKNLWQPPLFLSDKSQWQNPESHPDYKRVKLLGRYHRVSFRTEDIEVRPSVEHQIISLVTLLSSFEARTTLNHDVYRAERIKRVLVPKLFGGNFARLGLWSAS